MTTQLCARRLRSAPENQTDPYPGRSSGAAANNPGRGAGIVSSGFTAISHASLSASNHMILRRSTSPSLNAPSRSAHMLSIATSGRLAGTRTRAGRRVEVFSISLGDRSLVGLAARSRRDVVAVLGVALSTGVGEYEWRRGRGAR